MVPLITVYSHWKNIPFTNNFFQFFKLLLAFLHWVFCGIFWMCNHTFQNNNIAFLESLASFLLFCIILFSIQRIKISKVDNFERWKLLLIFLEKEKYAYKILLQKSCTSRQIKYKTFPRVSKYFFAESQKWEFSAVTKFFGRYFKLLRQVSFQSLFFRT